MKFSLISAVALANCVAGEVGLSLPADGAIRLGFDVYRGSHKADLSRRDQLGAYLSKRDGSVSMQVENQRTFYMTELKIGGTDSLGVLVDTGSLDLWVMSHDITCMTAPSGSSKEVIENFEVLFDEKTDGQDDNKKKEQENADENKDEKEVPTPTQNKPFFTTIYLTDLPSGNPFGTSLPTGSGSGGSGNSPMQGLETNTCTQYGSFNTAGSDSFKVNSSASQFLITYADGTRALGFWGYDDVQIGNSSTTVDALSFAVVNETSSNVGVLGIGLPGLETTYLTRNGGGYQYENLPLKMKNQGLIHKSAYSLYLGRSSDVHGEILFGAVDHAKYSGTLSTMPVVNTQKQMGYDTAIRLEVVVDLVTLNSQSNMSVTSNSYAALLDTGSTLSYFPTDLLNKFASMIGARYSNSFGAYVMLCPGDDNDVNVTVSFSGQNIEISLSALALQVLSSQCQLGVIEQDSDLILFGDNVLRHMYVVYDLEDLEISIAQANFSNDTDIEVISSSVPSATRAAQYSATALSSASEASATGTMSYSGGGGSSGSSSSGSSGSNHKSGGVLIGVLMMMLGLMMGVAVV